jgi:hypothetical protein
MTTRFTSCKRVAALGLLAVAASGSTAFAGCPSMLGKASSGIVTAGFSTVTSAGVSTTTYTFSGLDPAHTSVKGAPGLISFCVYPAQALMPTGGIVANADGSLGSLAAIGANSEAFVVAKPGLRSFAFTRAHGDPSNISFDGAVYTMGTAAWNGVAPRKQKLLLHINDAAECASLYGAGSSNTCWVIPNGTINPPPGE